MTTAQALMMFLSGSIVGLVVGCWLTAALYREEIRESYVPKLGPIGRQQ